MDRYGLEDARALIERKRAGERVGLDPGLLEAWRPRVDALFAQLDVARETSPLPEIRQANASSASGCLRYADCASLSRSVSCTREVVKVEAVALHVVAGGHFVEGCHHTLDRLVSARRRDERKPGSQQVTPSLPL